MSKKSLLLKILFAVWALALIVVGVIQYKDSKSCSSCQADISFFESLSESQKEELKKHRAAVLIPDDSDPIYVDENTAYNHAQITSFSTAQPNPLTEDEIAHSQKRMLYSKYVEKMPPKYRSLLAKRKLAVILSESGDFFVVALSQYMQNL
jgi:hypothetical protein